MSPRQVVSAAVIMLIGAMGFSYISSREAAWLGSANAQTTSDHPAAFTGSLTDPPARQTLSVRGLVYVPAYSAIRLGAGKGKLDLATTLGIHNTSGERTLVILRADYFDTFGELLHRYVPEPIAVRPLGSVEAFVPVEDTRGGTGANFVVEWASAGDISEPLVEAVMIGSMGTQGYSFTSRGKPMQSFAVP